MRFPQEKHLVKAYIIQAFSNLFRVHAFISRTSEQSYYSPESALTHLLITNETISKYPGSLVFSLLFKFITQLLSCKFSVTGNISRDINYTASASASCNSYYIMSVVNWKIPGACVPPYRSILPKLFSFIKSTSWRVWGLWDCLLPTCTSVL